MKTFSERLRSIRGKESQTSFAKKLGLTQVSYGRYEIGTREPDLKTLCRMGTILGVSADWLLGLDDRSPSSIHAHNSAVAVNGHAVNSGASAPGPCSECANKDTTIARLERVIDKLTK